MRSYLSARPYSSVSSTPKESERAKKTNHKTITLSAAARR